ncbi:MAG: SDR family NAD(P)-dependent oxidoreductase [Leptospirillia bacterium]
MNSTHNQSSRWQGQPRPVLVTGASSGIGRAAALMLRERGYRVFASARDPGDVTALNADGFEGVKLDLSSSRSVRRAADSVLSATDGRLYGLFNNAAYGQPGAVEDLSRKALSAQFEVNLFGTVELTNSILPAMRAAGEGRIVMNSSVLGFVAMPYRGAYNASKYALEGITDTLRLELAGSGVFVSLIEPGPIASRFRVNAQAAFDRQVDVAASIHREKYREMGEKRLSGAGAAARFTLPPEAVAKKLIRALEARRPKPRYYVTLPTHLFGVLKRVLTDRMLDRILRFAG